MYINIGRNHTNHVFLASYVQLDKSLQAPHVVLHLVIPNGPKVNKTEAAIEHGSAALIESDFSQQIAK